MGLFEGGMIMISVTVKRAAEHLGISEQRVRVLLRSGRLSGYRTSPREWRVNIPYTVRPGKRGPRFGARPKGQKASA